MEVFFSVPQNYFGFQNSFFGKAYAGITSYWKVTSNYREYVAVKLKQKLKINQKYCISIKISLADSCRYASNNISVGFFDDTLYLDQPILNPLNKIELSQNITLDKINWQNLTSNFISKGQENILVIGNFSNDANTIYNKVNDGSKDTLFDFSYYYVDNVELISCETSSQSIVNFDLNTITPNDDGYNDFFDFSKFELSKFNFQVFNRWGSLVFKTNDKNTIWRGQNLSNNILPYGTYFYIIEGEEEGEKFKKHNYVQLIK